MQAWTVPPVPSLPTPPERPRRRLRLFDTASGGLVPAGPVTGEARMYVCGITPYDATHIGHANTYLAFDLVHRAWRDAGLTVRYVQNVTDVDDPLLDRARATGVDWRTLAEEQTALFGEDMAALNVLPPTSYIGAVESMPLVLDLIGELADRGAVYAVEDHEHPDLYFAVASDARFGSLSHLGDDAATALFSERGGDPDRTGKKAPLDCLVWQGDRPAEPAWDSPYGPGRPGWHIECAAIALAELGPGFDVQGGGSDLVFPHHEMTAAQARVATDQPFAQVYAHSGMVSLDGEKMSKSRGNLVFVSRLRAAGTDPMALRLALLSHHYREEWAWTDELLTAAEDRLRRWREAVGLATALPAAAVVEQLREALADDLNAPAALAAVDAWAAGATAV
ncbi:MAG: cysteine--1-D-myo-inosityl 2-amino-2-deoxy-alpha-D-glucopyranoside ligase, partial [Actinomycetes bacterium]